MQDNRFEELDARCRELLVQIDRSQDNRELVAFKKEYHKTKLMMIDILTLEDKSKGMTARELIADVNSRKKVPRYETGIRGLDEAFNGGIETGTFIQLAGQSFTGKTHLVLEILSNIAGAWGAVLFNFEMGDVRIAHRLNRLLTTDEQLDNLIIDSRTRDIDDLINEIKIYARKGVKFFAVDSKMKITSSEKDDMKRFAEISSKLSRVCQENDIIVFLINQMNEADLQSKRLAFKGSGDQMYDTDIALFYMLNDDDTRTLICSKNRQDERGFVMNTWLDYSGKVQMNEVRKDGEPPRDKPVEIVYEEAETSASLPVI